jgi:hypothetical protein
MDGTIVGQGSFTASANNTPRLVVIPSGVDWMYVYNYTLAGTDGATAPALGFQFYWQRGMAAGTGMVWYKEDGSPIVSADTLLSGGFTLYDPSGQTAGAVPLVGNPVATTASTNATRPVVSTADTTGVEVGTVVRMSNTAQDDVNGIDMVVGAVVANTSFTLLTATNALATAPGVVGGAGFYRIINVDSLFYPRRRYVVDISNAVNAQVSTSVEHSLTPGQQVRFRIPAESGMIQLNSTAENNYLSATVVQVLDAYNFTIDVDTSAFTAFTWPTDAQTPCDFPQVVPFGEDTGASLSSVFAQTPLYQGEQIYNTNTGLLADSTVNTGFLGMSLGIGGDGNALGAAITGPAGSAEGEVIYWRAGKSSFGGL